MELEAGVDPSLSNLPQLAQRPSSAPSVHFQDPQAEPHEGVTRSRSLEGTGSSGALVPTTTAGVDRPSHMPSLPTLSTTKSGRVVIVSNEQAQREVWEYGHRAWERCRDGRLPWPERARAFQRAVFCTFEYPRSNRAARAIAIVLVGAVLANACNLITASFPAGLHQPMTCAHPVCTPGEPGATCTRVICAPTETNTVLAINTACVVAFTIDYLARLLTIHAVPPGIIYARDLAIDLEGHVIQNPRVRGSGWSSTRDYALSFMGLVDLFAIAPFFVNFFAFKPYLSLHTSDTNLLSFLHMSRAVRTLKLLRYSRHTILFSRTLQAATPALKFFFVLSFTILLLSACVVFFLERGVFKLTPEYPDGAFLRRVPGGQDEAVSPFTNILVAFYWTVVSTTTLKQSDLMVSSPGARAISVVLAYVGVLLLALPLSIIGRHFQRQYDMCNIGTVASQGGGQAFFPDDASDDASDKV